MRKSYLGIDLGGTEVKLAVVDENGEMCEQRGFSNSSRFLPAEVVENIITHARSMKHFGELSGTGIGVAGDIDQENGIVRFSPNLPTWKRTPLRKMLASALPGPIAVDNDANAAALGAYWLDAKGKVKNLICVTLGTGVGGGLVFEGKLYRGATGSAGEIGHMPLDPYGPQCNCGSRGCIERYVGAAYLSLAAKQALIKNRNNGKIIYHMVNGNLDAITPEILTQAAKRGDAQANEIWQQAGERLGIILAGVINLLNPEVIVLAGGVSKANQLLLRPIRKTVKERAFDTPARACRIIISKYNKKLGVVGAALLTK